ncbi:hypothetical protein FSP39_019617 [Pinctada imbricata]|uniref:Uncharacterized protein n=1 Tax=Pinctada imbricata TaxID=66713 RepID=A0AA88YEG9_PINIB|nr:hypothetical protein FSP39_019617 [Pinctada imbricata]
MRKKQVRFGEGNDLQLLREVIAKNPFKDRSKWTEIAETLPIDCDARRVRERTLLLVNQHKGKNAESKKKSGIDEAYGEKDQLLDEVLEISEEEEISKKAEKEKAREFEQAGKNIRKRAMETLCKSRHS